MVDTHNPADWPRGAGSLQFRSNSLWLIYRNTDEKLIQENTGITDLAAARRMLADRAIKTLRSRISAIRAVVDEEAQKAGAADPDDRQVQERDQRRSRRRVVRPDAQSRAGRKSPKGAKR